MSTVLLLSDRILNIRIGEFKALCLLEVEVSMTLGRLVFLMTNFWKQIGLYLKTINDVSGTPNRFHFLTIYAFLSNVFL